MVASDEVPLSGYSTHTTGSRTTWNRSRSPVRTARRSSGPGRGRDRADDVVGLVAGGLGHRQAGRVEHFQQQRDLAGELGRVVGPGRLVAGVQVDPPLGRQSASNTLAKCLRAPASTATRETMSR